MYPLNLASTVILFDQSPMQPKLHCYGHQVHIDQYRINLYHIRYRHTHIDKTGTPGQIRTPNHMLLRQAALPISVRGHNNFRSSSGLSPHGSPHTPVGRQYGHTAFHVLVRPPGIEPGSPVLQTGAMTTSAKDAKLASLQGFEP